MLRKTPYLILTFSLVLFLSCGSKKDNSAASMEQLHAENGQPVSIRELETEDFPVYLKYPALINASSESTASATLNDVVRSISVRVGDTVRQGDVIVAFSSDNQILQQATLAHGNARSAFERMSILFRSNDISRQDFDTVRMQYEMSQANLKAANDMVYVKAPISGTITQINVRTTQNVRPGTPLFSVSNSNAFEATFYVGVEEIERVQVGARVFIDLSRGKNEKQQVEGRITQVSLAMDSQKQAFPVTVFFNGADHLVGSTAGNSIAPMANRLVSGMNIDIAVEVYRSEKAIVLYRQEIIQTENGPAVFVAEGNKVRQVPVRTGMERGLSVEIVGGLNAGEILISEGVQQINAGSKINIVPALLANLR